jgi:hypothetical protein
VHDLKLPLFFVIGVRGFYAHQQGASADSCPVYTEPVLRAWHVSYSILDKNRAAEDLKTALHVARSEHRAGVVLLAE